MRKISSKDNPEQVSRSLFERLSRRGIEYAEIKKIVSFDLPHATLYFERHFGAHAANKALQQIERWKHLLKDDFILSDVQKGEIQKTLAGSEMFAWNALIEVSFPKLGPWRLSQRFLPTVRDPYPRFVNPDLQIVAVHERTDEKRTAVIPGGRDSVSSWGSVWRTAFAELGLLELVLKHRAPKRLVSARRPQAWPVFTMAVIPRLYDFLGPFYRKRGHVWSEKENVLKRNAFFSNELLDDMRDILRLEHPDIFAQMTRDHLKARIQSHVRRVRGSIKSSK